MTESTGEFTPTKKARLRAATMAFIVIGLIVGAWGLVGVSYVTYKSYQQSSQNAELLENVQDTNDRLLDCTEPGGKCYDEGQARTAEAVGGINEGTYFVVVAALSCQADGITDTKPLADCTAKRAEQLASAAKQ